MGILIALVAIPIGVAFGLAKAFYKKVEATSGSATAEAEKAAVLAIKAASAKASDGDRVEALEAGRKAEAAMARARSWRLAAAVVTPIVGYLAAITTVAIFYRLWFWWA